MKIDDLAALRLKAEAPMLLQESLSLHEYGPTFWSRFVEELKRLVVPFKAGPLNLTGVRADVCPSGSLGSGGVQCLVDASLMSGITSGQPSEARVTFSYREGEDKIQGQRVGSPDLRAPGPAPSLRLRSRENNGLIATDDVGKFEMDPEEAAKFVFEGLLGELKP